MEISFYSVKINIKLIQYFISFYVGGYTLNKLPFCTNMIENDTPVFPSFILKSVCLDITTVTAARHVNIPLLEKDVFKSVPVRKTCVTSCLGAEKASTFINILVYMYINCRCFWKRNAPSLHYLKQFFKMLFFKIASTTIKDQRSTVKINFVAASIITIFFI